MKRIRYRKTGESNKLRSVKTYQHMTNGGRFIVYINTDTLELQITDEMAENREVTSASAKNMHQLKMLAKQTLADLGIEFDSEERLKNQAS